MNLIYDCIIIGAGPGGLTAAIYLKRANKNVCIIEKGAPGGQMINSYQIDNYPGSPNISGVDLAMNMYNQIVALDIDVFFEEVKKISDGFKVETEDNIYEANNVIIASGQRPRKLDVRNANGLYGRGISFCAVCDASFYKGKDVIVVGGGNSSFEESLYLANVVNKVYILVRNKPRADKLLIDKSLAKGNIEILEGTSVLEFIDESGFKGAITNKGIIKANGCFLYIGNEPQTEFISLDVLNDKGYVITDEHMETKIKGLFAIGDVREKELRQIVTATSDGAIAANEIVKRGE